MAVTNAAITGMSVASCLGEDLDVLAQRLAECRHGLHTQHRFRHLFPDTPLGEIDHRLTAAEASALGMHDSLLMRMVARAWRRAVVETKLLDRYAADEIGVFLGSTTGGLERLEARLHQAFGQSTGGLDLKYVLDPGTNLGSIAHALRQVFDLSGPVQIVSAACASGALAIKEAREALDAGLVKAAVAGGFDVLAPMTIGGFASLQVLSEKICAPFKTMDGINLAEGGALLVMEAEPDPLRVKGWLCGAGTSSDAHHMTQPEPSGAGMLRAVKGALDDAGLLPLDIGYINPHGTGTRQNDEAERRALEYLWGCPLELESTKALHGHTLGGAGALEAVVSLLEMTRRGVPTALSNSFGFGGTNVSLIFRRGL